MQRTNKNLNNYRYLYYLLQARETTTRVAKSISVEILNRIRRESDASFLHESWSVEKQNRCILRFLL